MATFRKILRRTLIGLIALFLLPILAAVVIAWLEISVSVAPWRGAIARAASEAIGREVKLEGPLEFVPSMRPLIKVGGIHIANPPGFSAPEFASLGAARLWLDLFGALRYQFRVREISADDVVVRLEQTAEGRGNWVFNLPQAAPPAAGSLPAKPMQMPVGFSFDVDTIALRKLSVEYMQQPNGRRHFFDLDELKGEAARGQPIKVTLRGSVEKSFPYLLTFTGGSGSELLNPTKPWPVEVSFEFLGTALQVTGSLTKPLQGGAVDLVVGLGTEDHSQIERLLQTTLPKVGPMALSGRVQWDDGKLLVSGLRGTMGSTTLEGDLEFETQGKRPRLSGKLALPTLDLRPFMGTAPSPGSAPPASLLDTYRELERQTFSLRELNAMDVDLTLGVGKWLSMPGDMHDAQLGIRLKDGVLKAPVQATIAQVTLRGELDADGAAPVPKFQLDLHAENTGLGGLAELLANIKGMQGELGKFGLRLAARGETLGALTRTLDVRLRVADGRLSYGNVEGGRPVEFRLRGLDVALPGGGPLEGKARGSLLSEPFDAQFKAGDLPTLAKTLRWPLTLTVRAAGGAQFNLDGVIAPPEVQSGVDLRFKLTAARAGSVGRWLGLSPTAQPSLALSGRALVSSDEWRLRDFVFHLGRTAMTGDFARVGIDKKPLVQALLDVENVDVEELESMPAQEPAKPAKAPAASPALTLDLPILPKGLDLSDADLEVRVRRVDMRPAAATDVTFNGRIRDGHMDPAPIAANYAGTPFSGAVAFDLRGDVPEASLWLAAGPVDIGQLLRKLKIVEDLDARVESLRLQLTGRGSRLGEMLEKSSFEADLEDGAFTLRDPNRHPLVAVRVKQGVVSADPDKPVRLKLDGAIDQTPVTIAISSGTLLDFLKTTSSVPFALGAQAAGAKLDLNGKVSLPITQGTGELTLRVTGERFDTLNQLARTQLPPWGPWSFGGRFLASASGYEVPDLEVRIGESRLNGRGSYRTSGARPRIDVQLRAPTVQLDDFKFGAWSPLEKKPARNEKPMSVEEMRAKAKEAAAEGQKLLSPEVLLKQDAFLDVDVTQVLSGADLLGNGKLHVQIEERRLTFRPAEVTVPGGSARLSAMYHPTDTDVEVQAQVRVERFDYGILARRIKPDTDLQGLFSLYMDLDARAPSLDGLMQRANGRIDFAVWPRNMRSGIFDLWAVNLFLALVPAVDPASESKINCAVGRFDLRDGKLTQDTILMDTSRMRVSGTGRVDFDTETLAFRLAPKAKTAQFFSLATPIGVTGTLTNFKVGVAPGGLMDTAARFLTSIFVVPIQKLTEQSPPRDGADVCDKATRVVGVRGAVGYQ
jgi:hypothetical protein